MADEKPKVEKVTRLIVIPLLILLSGLRASAQVPGEALRAEGEQRWNDALEIYSALLRDHPDRPDVWLRVADIQASLGHEDAAIHALEQAAARKADDPALYARLSQAYAAAGQPGPALLAMQGALALAPHDVDYLKAEGQLASWKGDYRTAADAYRRWLADDPKQADAWLLLARVSVWGGDTDSATGAYKAYVARRPLDRTAWVEWARAESYRGNDRGALRVLASMRQRVGTAPDEQKERASVLTRAGHPAAALATLAPLLRDAPHDVDLRITDALARIAYGDERGARAEHDWLSASPTPRPETKGIQSQIRSAFGSMFQPSASTYADSDHLGITRVPVLLSLAMAPGLRMDGGYEHDLLRARAGSGLESADGDLDQRVDQGWFQLAVRPGHAVQVRAQVGGAESNVRDAAIYAGGIALTPGDAVRVSYDYEHHLLVISPRTVSLGLTRDTSRARFSWTPLMPFVLDADVMYERLSDTNTRRALRVSPRVPVWRRQFMNVDLGASAYVFEVAHNLDHGYYDPARYEAYTVTLYPYLKFSENYGLSLFLEAGAQKDSSEAAFRPGGSAVGELTLGIYNAWALKVNGGLTLNSRLESGAFRGGTAGVLLLRRF